MESPGGRMFSATTSVPHGEAIGVTYAERLMVIPARDVLPLVQY